MADSKDEKEETEEPKAKANMKPVIFISLGVFVIALAGFSWMEGLFGPAPEIPVTEALQDKQPLANDVSEIAESADRGSTTSAEKAMEKQTARPGSLAAEVSTKSGSLSEPASGAEEAGWIDQEKKNLKVERAALDKRKRELDALEKEVRGLLGMVEKEKSKRIAMMAKLYDSMDPESVAKQINNMEDRTVVSLLPQMNTRTAAKVMALLDPKRAAIIATKLLALGS